MSEATLTTTIDTLTRECTALAATIMQTVADAERAWQTAMALLDEAHHGANVVEFVRKRQALKFLQEANGRPRSPLPDPITLPRPSLPGIEAPWLQRWQASDWRGDLRTPTDAALEVVKRVQADRRTWVQWRTKAGTVLSPHGLPV